MDEKRIIFLSQGFPEKVRDRILGLVGEGKLREAETFLKRANSTLPHPFTSYGKKRGEKRGFEPKKAESPKETLPNSMTTTYYPFCGGWRPNNYRRGVGVESYDNGVLFDTIRDYWGGKKISNSSHTKIISIKEFRDGITLQCMRNTIVAIRKQKGRGREKEYYSIRARSKEEYKRKVGMIELGIEQEMESAVREFVFRVGLKMVGVFFWVRHEDGARGEKYLDSVPKDVIFQNDLVKKVYDDEVEFVGGRDVEPTLGMMNYISSRAVEDIAPEIASSLERGFADLLKVNLEQSGVMGRVVESMDVFGENIKTHMGVLKGIEGAFKKFNSRMGQKRLGEWMK